MFTITGQHLICLLRSSGYLSKDAVTWCGLHLQKVTFGEVTSEAQNDGTFFDGIVGMGLGATTSNTRPLFQQFWDQGLLPDNVFSFYLQSRSGTATGELVLGGIDPSHYTGPIGTRSCLGDICSSAPDLSQSMRRSIRSSARS